MSFEGFLPLSFEKRKTSQNRSQKEKPRFELGVKDLQTSALPLGYISDKLQDFFPNLFAFNFTPIEKGSAAANWSPYTFFI